VKIRLYNPPVFYYSNVHYRMNPPLGLPILAAVLDEAGHDVRVIDLEAQMVTPTRLAEAYADASRAGISWPDAVGLTVTVHNERGARESVAALRGVGYAGQILVGGPQVTVNPGVWRGSSAVGVEGEAEGNIVEIVTEQAFDGWWEGEGLPIEYVPAPLWSKHTPQPTQYGGNEPNIGRPEGIAMWSRGCPHNCIFCGNPVFGHQKIRRAPPENVRRDMLQLKELGCKTAFVYDDELVGVGGKHHAWLRGACEAVADLGLTWKCQGRVSSRWVDADTLGSMAAAGCRAIMWGVESFSDEVLGALRKGTSERDIWDTLRVARDAGIGNWLFLMVGNYQESAKELAYTEKQITKAVAEGLVQWRQVTVCTPIAGTELYSKAKEDGWLVEAPQTGPQMAQDYASTPWLSQREIKHWRQRLLSA